jgi:hypothetical protein
MLAYSWLFNGRPKCPYFQELAFEAVHLDSKDPAGLIIDVKAKERLLNDIETSSATRACNLWPTFCKHLQTLLISG